MKSIDVHAHILPDCFLALADSGSLADVALVRDAVGAPRAVRLGGSMHPCTPEFYDAQAQLAWMDAHGIARQAIAIAPRLFFYDLPGQWNRKFCRACNTEILARCAAHPQRFLPVGSLPMQDIPSAVEEVDFLAENGGRMVQIGTTIHGLCLDDPSFLPVYKALQRHDMLLMLHPLIGRGDEQTRRYHLSNVVGNPYQTTAAACSLIAGGVLDEVPGLQVLLVHGGGFLPYQLDRLNHAFEVRPQDGFRCALPPRAYLRRNFWFDGLLFGTEPLGLLLAMAGSNRVMFGTDYPYDMADVHQLERIEDAKAKAAVAYENARHVFRL